MQTKRLVGYWFGLVFFFSKCKGKGGSKEMDEACRRTCRRTEVLWHCEGQVLYRERHEGNEVKNQLVHWG